MNWSSPSGAAAPSLVKVGGDQKGVSELTIHISRRVVFLLILGVLLAIPAGSWASHRFSDVPDSNIFHDDISWLADAEVTKGCNPPANDEFCPSDAVTRQQMSAFMRRLAQYLDAEDGTPGQADNADTVDGLHGSAFAASDHDHAARPWSIHIGPEDMDNAGATWPNITFGSGTSALGMAFNDGVFGRVYLSFQLPDHYVAGTDLRMDLNWIPISGFGLPVFPCDVIFWTNDARVQRPGEEILVVGDTWEIPRGFDATATRLTATQNLFDDDIVSGTYTVIDGSALLPGDMLSTTLNRDGDEFDDTCEGIMVTGLEVYENR